MMLSVLYFFFFFFNDTATTEIYTLSLHDALPICHQWLLGRDVPTANLHLAHLLRRGQDGTEAEQVLAQLEHQRVDRKSTRLNSSHANISYAVFCLKKKKITTAFIIQTFNSTKLLL